MPVQVVPSAQAWLRALQAGEALEVDVSQGAYIGSLGVAKAFRDATGLDVVASVSPKAGKTFIVQKRAKGK